MGSWNQTCAISNLPIYSGTPVVGLFFIDTPGDKFEGTLYGRVLPFYIEGEYNDYGAIENPHGVMLEPIMTALRASIMPMEQGENEYHDIAVDPDNLTFGQLMDADHEGRLHVKNRTFGRVGDGGYGHTDGFAPMHHLEIRKDVFDEIMESHEFHVYKESDKSWDDIGISTIMEDWRGFYAKLKEKCPLGSLARETLLFEDRDNYIGSMLARARSQDNEIINSRRYILDMCDSGATEEELYAVVENAIQAQILNIFMGRLHRHWTVPGNAGQEGNVHAHCLLAKMIIDYSENEHNSEWEESDSEYYLDSDGELAVDENGDLIVDSR